mgnify:CR=1 FL=1
MYNVTSMSDEEEVLNAYAKWETTGGTANTFAKIWKWMKKNDKKNALMFRVDNKKIRGIPGHCLPNVDDDLTVIRLPRSGNKFEMDRSLYGVGAELRVMFGAEPVSMLIEPGFRPDGMLRLVRLEQLNIANK